MGGDARDFGNIVSLYFLCVLFFASLVSLSDRCEFRESHRYSVFICLYSFAVFEYTYNLCQQ